MLQNRYLIKKGCDVMTFGEVTNIARITKCEFYRLSTPDYICKYSDNFLEDGIILRIILDDEREDIIVKNWKPWSSAIEGQPHCANNVNDLQALDWEIKPQEVSS